jgi:ribosomal protein S12 methylthiotransferase accessory factor
MESLIQRIETDLVNPWVGILSSVNEVRRPAGAPNFFHYMAWAADTIALTGLANSSYGGGAASSSDRAKQKAMGEAVERYCSAFYDPEHLILSSAADLSQEAIDPKRFALYSENQYLQPTFPWVPFDRDTKVRWTVATDAITGRSVLVPACRVFVPYKYYLGDGESPIDQPISTGLACHESFEVAAVNAICEVIERDHLMLTWQARITVPRLDICTLPNNLRNVADRFHSANYELALFDITLDSKITTILSILRSKDSVRLFVVAAASALNPATAVLKSFEELAHTRHYCEIIAGLARSGRLAVTGVEDVTNQITHLAYYQRTENQMAADFLFGSAEIRRFEDLANLSTGSAQSDVDVLVKRIDSMGEQLFMKDVTTSDVASLGLSVVRAIIPGAHPLRMGYALRALGGKRLYSIPYIGPHVPVVGDNDNPHPHPYP